MNFSELQVTLSFCIIFLLRMLGMFMILPVLSKYGMLLDGGNKFLIGLSIGIYGISQVIFQIPFGILSDKFSRKKIIIFGLLIFFIGNIICASVHSIWGLIIGRFLQGSGAISGVCMAFLSDLIQEKNRVKAIACIGVSFAFSFLIAMISGPLMVKYFGFFSLFWTSSFLSIICIIIVFFTFPYSDKNTAYKNKNILNNQVLGFIFKKNFMRSYIGIFFLHFLLMMNFMIIPNQFELSGLSLNNHWKVYLFTILVSFIILFLFIFYCKIKYVLDYIIEISIIFLFFSEIIFIESTDHLLFSIIALQVFFLSFNFLEVFLPSHLNKQELYNYKGSIMSMYSTSQFLGISLGGICSGWLYTFLNIKQMFLFEILIILFWLIFSLFCKKNCLLEKKT
ncbi:MFS transporter [Buchnera aphidicola]|uniref:Yajr n=1 Tax=Buchnera aphidicola str. USDA (Myzus persicae) TaxID=1009856 RepID=W0NZL1_BUCMP|nr:MFS transporter [Buchnera aphidicola]AHG59931.1 Yajr [Buchnera aphidicola str. USDA (Myzus persicae)]AHG60511.1 Yajr [Buchnera aphidicola str. W106 (Myzus persicae)]AHG61084.1 Yajr [Buchnera aphidicola str. G002 (Myzus persicae)]AHG61656.1 Yajr [Buchnera aphidicola str. F009 (Myzus persicae)]WAI03382.1 MAG: MFS transporter [Buchnera aphidicola (Myzus persicae)]